MKDGILNGAICCIGENKPEYCMKLRNLFLSIDRFGGRISKLDRVVFFMGIPKDEYKRELEQLGVKIINTTPVHEKLRHNNKVRMLELDLGYDWYVLLDHDTIVCADFSKFLSKMTFKANPIDYSGPNFKFWEKIYKLFNLELPSKRYTSTLDRKEILPYFNSSVLLVPGCYRKSLYDAWIYYIHELIAIREQLNEFTFFIDQIGLSLALQKLNIEATSLPVEMNFHIHIPVNAKLSPEKIDPFIIHYHNCMDEFGYLNSSKYLSVYKKITKFNKLLQRYKFDNKKFWNDRYTKKPELGSGIGSLGDNLVYKRRLLKQLIDGKEIQSIIDIGCGNQFVSIDLPDDKYTGIDISSVIIEENKKNYPNRTFINADFLHINHMPVDMTICFDVLIHQENINKYRDFVVRFVNTTKKFGIISGYEECPKLRSGITFYYEPLSKTLRNAGAKNLRLIGKYREVCIWYFDIDESISDENSPIKLENTKKSLVKPTFIVGCMRSGTTLLANLLGKHPDIVYCPFELRQIWSKVGGVSMASPKTRDKNCPNLTSRDVQIGQSELLTQAFYSKFKNHLGNKSPAARFLSKNPHLCNKIQFVDALFPDARFIWIYRDLVKVVASLKKLFIKAYNKGKTWHYWPVKKDDETVRCWECYFGDELPENIDKSRCFPGGDIKYLAEYWYENNKAVAEFSRTISANRLLAIREEDLVTDPKLALAKCDAFLEIPLKITDAIDKIDSNRNELWVNVFNKEELQSLLDFIIKYEKNTDCIFIESKSITFYRKKISELLKLKENLKY